jgi:hypothetical protein
MQRWSETDKSYLKSNYNLMTDIQLMEHFNNRSWLSIYKEATGMGLRRNKAIEFLNRSASKKGEKSPNWHGGKTTNRKGYILRLMRGHPRADKKGYVMEHILVWEEATGISVKKDCCIHHLNGKKDDNRIENLCLMKFGAHTAFHHLGIHESDETRQKISESRKSKC